MAKLLHRSLFGTLVAVVAALGLVVPANGDPGNPDSDVRLSARKSESVEPCRALRTTKELKKHGLYWNRDNQKFLPSTGRLRGYVIYYGGRDDERLPYERDRLSLDRHGWFLNDMDPLFSEFQDNYEKWSNGNLTLDIWNFPEVLRTPRYRSDQIGAFNVDNGWLQARRVGEQASTVPGFGALDADFLIMVGLRPDGSSRGGGALHRSNYNIRLDQNTYLPTIMIEHQDDLSQERMGYVLNHEFGHLLGLPDLYAEGDNKPGYRLAGRNFLMDGSIENGPNGYARWLLGWIPDEQVECIQLDEELKETTVSRHELIHLESPDQSNVTPRLLVIAYGKPNLVGVVEARPRPRKYDDTPDSLLGDLTTLSYDVNANVKSSHWAGFSPDKGYEAAVVTARAGCDVAFANRGRERGPNYWLNGYWDDGGPQRRVWNQELARYAYALGGGTTELRPWVNSLFGEDQWPLTNSGTGIADTVSPLNEVLVANERRGSASLAVTDDTRFTVTRKKSGCARQFSPAIPREQWRPRDLESIEAHLVMDRCARGNCDRPWD